MHEERVERRRRLTRGEVLPWLLVAICGAAGFGLAFVVTGEDENPYGDSDWLLVAFAVAAVVLLVAAAVVRDRRGRRS